MLVMVDVDDDFNTGDIWNTTVTGVDGPGCGTIGTPCRTIQYVLTNNDLSSADVIRIDAGTYAEQNIGTGGTNDDEGFTFQ